MHLNHLPPKIVTKAWGKEKWLMLAKDFCVKEIHILRGSKTSYQWHRQKEEINFIEKGEAEVWLEDDSGAVIKHHLRAGDSFFVPVTKKHRVIALTDLEMFEVSNEFIDDVVRIDDEFGRGDGRIEAEHRLPAVLILAAGLGSRLKHYTAAKNKALVPINNRAAISHIIEQFPQEYEIVVAVGYKRESLEEYCRLAHPNRKFVFVEAEGWDDPKTDPGHSVWCCREKLQRPFYLAAADSLLGGPAPHIDGNWLGIYPTDYPEKYATLKVENGHVMDVVNKSPQGFEQAFMGLAAVFDYEVFWNELAAVPGHELVLAWKNVLKYPTLKAKQLKWFDVGNLDDLDIARRHFGDNSLSSQKVIDEVTYLVGDRVLKFHPDPAISSNRILRGTSLGKLAPDDLVGTDYFISYKWQPGENLYHCGPEVQQQFLTQLSRAINTSYQCKMPHLIVPFYEKKTLGRLGLFINRYGAQYLDTPYNINGTDRRSLQDLFAKIDYKPLLDNPFYTHFHGDLHFDNVIWSGKFTYVDWRESFAGCTTHGDLYYDLGKLYAGSLFSFELLKSDETVSLSEGSSTVMYNHEKRSDLAIFRGEYERWIQERGYDLNRVKLIAALAFLNIAPLHTDNWGKVLLFKAIEILDELLD